MADTIVHLANERFVRRTAIFGPAVNAGVVTLPPGATLGPRTQRDYQLVLVHAGSARVQVDGSERRIPSGHVGLLLPGRTEFFSFAQDQETRHSWLAMRPEHLASAERNILDQIVPCQVASVELQMTMEIAQRVLVKNEPPEYATLAAVIHAGLLLYAMEAAFASRDPCGQHPVIQRARVVIREHASEEFGVADLARAVGFSPEYLCRLFQRELGSTPGAVLREERLRLAMHLLEHTGLPIAEVARRAGFGNGQYCARVLRQATGITPKELRALAWATVSADAANPDHTNIGESSRPTAGTRMQ